MKKLLAIAALSTLAFAGSAQAGGYGYVGYGHGYGYGGYGHGGYVTTYVERPAYRVVRPVVVKRVIVKRHFVPSYGVYVGY